MKSSKRLLIMPAGHFQVPAVREAQAMGLSVLALDRNPAAEALQFADFAEAVDPAQIDAVTELARRYGVEGILSVASDPTLIPASMAAERLGLPGLPGDVAWRCRNKRLARKHLHKALPEYCPAFAVLANAGDARDAAQDLGFPLVLKPADGNGSKGVVVAEEQGLLEEAFHYALSFSREGAVIAEEFLDGQEVCVETLSAGGHTTVVAMGDSQAAQRPFCAITGHTMLSRCPAGELAQVEEAAKKILSAFGVTTGCAHLEFILASAGPKLIDLGARLSGGCISSDLVPLATGVNLLHAAIRVAMGDAPDTPAPVVAGAAIRFLTPSPGVVQTVDGLERALAAPGVVRVECRVRPGDRVRPLRNSDDRVGYVVAAGSDSAEAAVRAEHWAAYLSANVQTVGETETAAFSPGRRFRMAS